MAPGANPPLAATARAVVRAYPCSASVRIAARRMRCRVSARITSDDPPRADARLGEEPVQPAGQLGAPVAGHLGVEVVLQVVGQLQEDRWDDAAAQRTG